MEVPMTKSLTGTIIWVKVLLSIVVIGRLEASDLKFLGRLVDLL
jgi:hypothetical protein